MRSDSTPALPSWAAHAADLAPFGLAHLARDGTLSGANLEARRLLGLPPQDGPIVEWDRSISGRDRQRLHATLARSLALQDPARSHIRVLRADGGSGILGVGFHAVPAEDGALLYIQDASRERRYDLLVRGHARTQALVACAQPVKEVLRTALAVLEEAFPTTVAAAVAPGLAPPVWSLRALPPGLKQSLAGACATFSRARAQVTVTVSFDGPDTATDPLFEAARDAGFAAITLVPFSSISGAPLGGLALLHSAADPAVIGEGKLHALAGALVGHAIDAWRARAAAMEGERKLRTLLENLPGMAYRSLNDRQWTMEFISAGALDLTGFTAEQLEGPDGLAFSDLIHPDDVEAVWAQVQAALDKRQPFRLAYRIRTRLGQEKWCWEQGEGIYDDAGQPVALEGFILDVTDERRAREALQQSQEHVAIVLDGIAEAVLATDADGRITLMNRAAEALLAVSFADARGEPIAQVLHLEGGPIALAAVDVPTERGERLRRQEALVDRRGQRHDLSYTLAPLLDREGATIGFAFVGRDVTEQLRIEGQLQQAQKMEAIGRLAGGIAHDFNNMLTGMVGYADLLRLELADHPTHQRFVELILETARRAAELTNQLLSFARRRRIERRPVDLHDVVRDAIALLRRSVDPRITLELHLDAPYSMVSGDRTQLQNALLNLGLNARDAMPEGGVIRVHTGLVEGDAEDDLDGGPGLNVEVRVTDSGPGIPPADLAQIFEPFFTSKGGKGTGLGLATVYGTARAHRGVVSASNPEGGGAAFVLRLPILPPAPALDSGAPPSRAIVSGSGTVLLAESDPAVRAILTMMLDHLGYRVVSVTDGADAVARYRASPGDFDLALFGARMPTMGGAEAVGLLRAEGAIVPAVLISHADPPAVGDAYGADVQGVLVKPFDLAHLSQVIAHARHP